MIRTLVTLSFALFALSAQATPRVGDYAKFDATLSSGSQSITGALTLELLQQDSAGKFLQRQTVEFPGRAPDTQEEWKEGSDLLDDATLDQALANCPSFGGTLQTISVPAGTFNTCAVPFDNEESSGTVFVSKVPFGVVRQDSTNKADGLRVSTVLREFR